MFDLLWHSFGSLAVIAIKLCLFRCLLFDFFFFFGDGPMLVLSEGGVPIA